MTTRTGLFFAGLATLAAIGHMPSARAAEAVIPPFGHPLFYPVDSGKAPDFAGSSLIPSHPVFDFSGIPGWIHGKAITNAMKVTIPKFEMLVIRGSRVRGNSVVIPAGGLYFDASPARGELPMTGASDYFFGKREYFVDYDARIHVTRNAVVAPGHMTAAGNHLYTLLSPSIPKVVPDPVVHWRTFDGVSLRPWAFSVRWERPSASRPDQTPMTYLQGVIRAVDKKTGAVTFSTLTGTAIHSEWWANTLLFEGRAHPDQSILSNGTGIVIEGIDPGTHTVTFHFVKNGLARPARTLTAFTSPTLPENASLRSRMIAIDGGLAVVLWPKNAIDGHTVKLWVYSGVEHRKTGQFDFGFRHMAYVPIACPIAHHIGAMVTNTRPLALRPGKTLSLWGGYAKITVVSIQNGVVQFRVASESGSTPVLENTGTMDAVIGEGRAAHGILNSLDTTDLALDRDLSVDNHR